MELGHRCKAGKASFQHKEKHAFFQKSFQIGWEMLKEKILKIEVSNTCLFVILKAQNEVYQSISAENDPST